MRTHLDAAHGIADPIEGLYYGSKGMIESFDNWGRQWQERWDAQYADRAGHA
ncbi:hypothetical protein FRC08_004169 [Ceratobasidium sp. 394]|nr:hypothetical protein FRC08_004169 [Ceratobasidium sp. 394]